MELANIIKESFYIDQDLPVPIPIITISNKIVATAQNFICLNGLPKSYKTTFALHFIAAAITKKPIFEIEVNLQKNDKIVLIDTESGIYEFSKQMKLLKKTIHNNKLPNNFSAYLFRKFEPEIILAAIEQIIINDLPKIMFIDNLTELVLNPNDMIEAKKVIQFLKRITAEYNIVIVCLLHLGKSNPNNSLGNLGSYAARGCQSELKVSYDKDTNLTTLEAILMRSDLYFNPIQIYYDNESKNFLQNLEVKPIKKSSRKFILMEINKEDHINRLNVIFYNGSKQFEYNELVEEIKKIYGVGTNIAKQQIIPYLRGNKFIFTNDKQLNYI